ncbi:MAG: aldo/keto reductase [Firmicutes bacterium]|nr:aldo/keto reductase [Bacillota bacterium]
MPWLGIGVWESKEGREVEDAVTWALECGYRHIDTAAIYGNEAGVGRAINQSGIRREDLFLTTKLWNSRHGYDETLKAFEESRKKLAVDYVDLYLIHWAVAEKFVDTWRAFEKLLADGWVRAIGVSNFEPQHLETLMASATIKPAVNQVEFHPYLTQRSLYRFCGQHGIQMEAWSPLMRGGEPLRDPVVREIAARHGKTPAQVLIRWDLEQGVVTIPKSVHKERIKENADVFDFSLDAQEVEQIAALDCGRRSFPYDPNHVTFGLS